MVRKRHKPEEIVAKLRLVDAFTQVQSVAGAIKIVFSTAVSAALSAVPSARAGPLAAPNRVGRSSWVYRWAVSPIGGIGYDRLGRIQRLGGRASNGRLCTKRTDSRWVGSRIVMIATRCRFVGTCARTVPTAVASRPSAATLGAIILYKILAWTALINNVPVLARFCLTVGGHHHIFESTRLRRDRRFADSPLEQSGFEPSVPLLRKGPPVLPKGGLGTTSRARN